MPYLQERAGELNYIELKPTGHGWNVSVHRVWTKPIHYYRISAASIKRFEHIVNRDDYSNFNIELGRTGWAEIQLYRDDVLKTPWVSQ